MFFSFCVSQRHPEAEASEIRHRSSFFDFQRSGADIDRGRGGGIIILSTKRTTYPDSLRPAICPFEILVLLSYARALGAQDMCDLATPVRTGYWRRGG
jgi:hypothetical protein